MRLLRVDTIEEVLTKIDKYYGNIKLEIERVELVDCLGRTLAEDVLSKVDIPEFNRSTVDGYAVVAKDTFGASESLPVFLNLAGKVEMGQSTDLKVTPGNAVYVPTGGMIPEGADCMVMIEYVEALDERTIAVNALAAPGDGIIFRGDDIGIGVTALKKGTLLRPQEIGVLAAIGTAIVPVFEKPRVAVISTGDEIVDPLGDVKPGQVRDINTYTLSALSEQLGAEVTMRKIVRDDFDMMKQTISEAVRNNHIVLVSGGSSVGTKDVTAQVIDSFSEPGVFVHGVAVKPGKPTILGLVEKTAVFGLPGHPASALVIYKVFVEYLINKLMVRGSAKLKIEAESSTTIYSSPGKETFQMVDLEDSEEGYIARPVHAKSAAISHIARSKGYVRIPVNKEGIKKGEKIKVELF